jgi:16S rRNA (cytosine967-C5)-methyltransferase
LFEAVGALGILSYSPGRRLIIILDDARSIAARVVAHVMDGHSLAEVLPPALAELPAQARPFAQELSYGTLRWGPRLAFLVARLLRKPLRERDGDVRALLWLGLYQLLYSRVPAHAAVDGTVDASRALRKSWAAGLVNAVMRGFLKRRDELLAAAERDEQAATAHPAWWLDSLRRGRPDDWQGIVAANNARPPMTLRVNERRTSRDDYLKRLAVAGMAGGPAPFTASGVLLDQPVEVMQLPGFAEGLVSVQDGAAQLAAVLLDPQPGERILDACAAPGGKTAHLLERQPALREVVAVDKDAARLARVRDNLTRLGLEARCVTADAAATAEWWDGMSFDRVLLDAPCSGSGVIRRHPDIKYLRRPQDIEALAAQQQRLLSALWPLLKREGMLLYAVCSVLPEENEQVVQAFLAQHGDAREETVAVWGKPLAHGRLIVPGTEGMDGFYYACLRKD